MAYGASNSRQRQSSSRPPQREEHVQLRIDPIQGEVDDHVQDLHRRVVLLKNVAQEIEQETKYQNDLLHQLEETMAKAGAGLKNSMNRLSRAMVQHSSNHVLHVVMFALVCFFFVYLWSRLSR